MPWLNAAQAREVTRTRVIMSASAWQHIMVGSVIDAMDGDQHRQVPVNAFGSAENIAARSEDLLGNGFLYEHPVLFRSVRDLGLVSPGLSGR
jgi:hypothetical protein